MLYNTACRAKPGCTRTPARRRARLARCALRALTPPARGLAPVSRARPATTRARIRARPASPASSGPTPVRRAVRAARAVPPALAILSHPTPPRAPRATRHSCGDGQWTTLACTPVSDTACAACVDCGLGGYRVAECVAGSPAEQV